MITLQTRHWLEHMLTQMVPEWLTRLELAWSTESGQVGLAVYVDGMFPTLEDDIVPMWRWVGLSLLHSPRRSRLNNLKPGGWLFGDDLRAPA